MARQRRWVAVGLPHHITQRGNGRRDIFLDDRLKQIYLSILADEARRFQLRILGYCLMTNHVHLIAVPETEQAMAFTLRRAHGKFARYWNTQVGTVGHMWQNRYFSCPVEPARVWSVLRYVEQNPVRAGMVPKATDYPWSSAAPHTQGIGAHRILDMSWWSREWTSGDWITALNAPWQTGEIDAIRRATTAGRPLADSQFLKILEGRFGYSPGPGRRGRPRMPLAQAAGGGTSE